MQRRWSIKDWNPAVASLHVFAPGMGVCAAEPLIASSGPVLDYGVEEIANLVTLYVNGLQNQMFTYHSMVRGTNPLSSVPPFKSICSLVVDRIPEEQQPTILASDTARLSANARALIK